MESQVEQEYTGWRDRLYLIDEAGKIRFKTEAGPFGFDAKKLAVALQAMRFYLSARSSIWQSSGRLNACPTCFVNH